jgi:hypothetical protein
MHIAAMLGVKVITLWEQPSYGFNLNQPMENALVSDISISKIPTSVYGNKKCRLSRGYANDSR